MESVNRYRHLLRLIVAAALALSAMQASAACLSAAEERSVREAGQAIALEVALRRAGISGKVLNAELCTEAGGYIWSVTVDQGGTLRTIAIPAS